MHTFIMTYLDTVSDLLTSNDIYDTLRQHVKGYYENADNQ